jgi:type III restriction enzyme
VRSRVCSADDVAGPALLADASNALTSALNASLDGLAAERKAAADKGVEDLLAMTLRRTRMNTVGEDVGPGPEIRTIATHAADVARDAQRIINAVPEGVGKAWFAHRVQEDPGADRSSIRVRCAALLSLDGVRGRLGDVATAWAKDQLHKHRVAIRNTTGATRDAYTRVMEQTSSPEAVTVQLRFNERAATKDREGEDLPTYPGHLFADAEGRFPVDLNEWEGRVVEAETARAGFVAWYRNPGTATPASLRIAYLNDAGEWASLQPDFIVVSRRTDGIARCVDHRSSRRPPG